MASALKREGVRLYDLHRRGLTVEREARSVKIHTLALKDVDPTEVTATFEVSCTSGTYVRTLIHDLATALGSAPTSPLSAATASAISPSTTPQPPQSSPLIPLITT
jgi:tRNA pseudouridine55 synthase